MDGVILTPLKKIYNHSGDIFHGMKTTDKGYHGFGEAYFSCVNKGAIKGWKKHNRITLNLVVIIGEIQFVIFNGKNYFEAKLSMDNYQRLTVEAGLWIAFKGFSKKNILLNLANIEHDPNECDVTNLDSFDYNWNKN